MSKSVEQRSRNVSAESPSRLRSALRLKEQEVAILYQISRAISGNLNLEDVLHEIVDLVTHVTKGDSCLLYLLDKPREELVLRASKNPHPRIIGRIKVRLGEGITGWVAQERQPVAIQKDASNDPRFKLFHNLPEDRYQAFLSVPVITKNEVIGVINVQHLRPHRHSSSEKTLLETLSNVSQTITSHHFLEEMLQFIVGMIAETMNSPICSIMLLDDEGKELEIKATHSLSQDYASKPNISVHRSLLGRVVKGRKPLVIRDVTQERGYAYRELARREGLRSLVSVPLMIKDLVIGVFNLYSSQERSFSREEMQLLTSVANQAAVAIQNAKLMSETIAMKEALETRKIVERAKGILLKEERLAEADAYRRIQQKSMKLRKSMREISEAIILAAEVKG